MERDNGQSANPNKKNNEKKKEAVAVVDRKPVRYGHFIK